MPTEAPALLPNSPPSFRMQQRISLRFSEGLSDLFLHHNYSLILFNISLVE